MPASDETYTYRNGKRLRLRKRADQFVVRAAPDRVARLRMGDARRVSSASSRVTVARDRLEDAMTRSRLIAPTHHAYEIADNGEEFLITDRILVRFERDLSPSELDEFVGRYALVLLDSYSERDYLFQLTDHTGMNPVKLIVLLTEDEPLVETAEHDLNIRASTEQLALPTDPSYGRQWHLHTRSTSSSFDPRASTRCEEAWSLLGHHGSSDVVIGMSDDGCKLDHADFNSPGKFAGWGYFQGSRLVRDIDIDADPALMYQAGSNHGTSCCGVIAAELDATLTVGAAPGCRLLPIKWESSGSSLFTSDSKLLTTLNYLADKVDIMSNSWGSVPTKFWSSMVVERIRALAKTGGRRDKGILFLWAAGNEACPIKHTATVDVPFTSGWEERNGSSVWVGVRTGRRFDNNLVGVPGVLHVAALASNAMRSHYSNYGTGIAVCAPTSNSHKYRRLTVRGLGVTTTTGSGGGTTPSFGGTSSATPLTAGIAALVISANPNLKALEVASILKRTASKELSLDGYARTPPATFDPDTSWDVSPVAPFDRGDFKDISSADGSWSPWFGHGRVDAPAAVAEAGGGAVAGESVHVEVAPNAAVPDDDPAGITSSLEVDRAGRIERAVLTLNVEHSWIGDLRVQLSAPDGTALVVHDRQGSGTDNISQSFDSANFPRLAALVGRTAQGRWNLSVSDLAQADEGVLKRWSLDLTLGAASLAREDVSAVPVPDDDSSGVSRLLEFPAGSVIADMSVAVDITHPFVGDLLVALTAPNNSVINLHDRSGGNADNIIRTWRMSELAGLRALQGLDAGGTWKLRVADLERRDAGKLNRWRIEVTS
ncbi:MAG: S8 family serine peptidase [Actinomycetota bacterium]